MIVFTTDKEIYMECASCEEAKYVQMLVIGNNTDPEYVVPLCDDCRPELAAQAAQPVKIKRKVIGNVIEVNFRKAGSAI